MTKSASFKIELEIASEVVAAIGTGQLAEFERQVNEFAAQLLGDLAIPLKPTTSVVALAGMDLPLAARINGSVARISRHLPSKDSLLTARDAALAAASVLVDNRELFIDHGLATRLRESWRGRGNALLSALSPQELTHMLRLLVRRGYRLDRGQQENERGRFGPESWTAESCFEWMVGSLSNVGMALQGAVIDHPTLTQLRSVAMEAQESAFWRLGIRAPYPKIEVDTSLRANEWRVKINDLRLPPFPGLASDEALVVTAPPRLEFLGLKARAFRDPLTNTDFSRATLGAAEQQRCRDAGFTVVTPIQYIGRRLAACMQQHAGCFIVLETVRFDLDSLVAHGDLVRLFREKWSHTRLAQVMRALVDERIPVLNLPAVLDGLLAAQPVVEADFTRNLVFTPYALTPCAKDKGEGGAADPNSADYADCLRAQFKELITYQLGRERRIEAILLDPALEEKLTGSSREPLAGQDRDKLMKALDNEFGKTDRSGRQVILTTLGARRPCRDFLAVEYPQVDVVSYQELTPDSQIMPLARIGW